VSVVIIGTPGIAVLGVDDWLEVVVIGTPGVAALRLEDWLGIRLRRERQGHQKM
jgi:hypothetical protein